MDASASIKRCLQKNYESVSNVIISYKLAENNKPNPPGNNVRVLSLHKHILQPYCFLYLLLFLISVTSFAAHVAY